MCAAFNQEKATLGAFNKFKLREGVFQALLREMCLSDESLSVCQNIEERIDIGVAVIEPSAGKHI